MLLIKINDAFHDLNMQLIATNNWEKYKRECEVLQAAKTLAEKWDYEIARWALTKEAYGQMNCSHQHYKILVEALQMHGINLNCVNDYNCSIDSLLRTLTHKEA